MDNVKLRRVSPASVSGQLTEIGSAPLDEKGILEGRLSKGSGCGSGS